MNCHGNLCLCYKFTIASLKNLNFVEQYWQITELLKSYSVRQALIDFKKRFDMPF